VPAGRPKAIFIEREQVNLRLPTDMMDLLRGLAERDQVFVTTAIVRVLEAGLQAIGAAEGWPEPLPAPPKEPG
jgi:hypothetical protein